MLEALLLSAICEGHRIDLPDGDYLIVTENECGPIVAMTYEWKVMGIIYLTPLTSLRESSTLSALVR